MEEKHFITQAGYEAHILFVNNSHYCGYVVIDGFHAAFGLKGFTWSVEIDDISPELIEKIEVIKAVNNIEVHGGITYDGDSLIDLVLQEEGKWVYGFDAAHSGDATKSKYYTNYVGEDVFRDMRYMEHQCENLATQLKIIDNEAKK